MFTGPDSASRAAPIIRLPRPLLPALAVLAALNMALAVWLMLTQPRYASDLLTVYGWCRGWLYHGANVYVMADAGADYPPNAIVTFSPLALLPWRLLVPLGTVVGLPLASLLPSLVLRAGAARHRWPAALPVLLFLCWGGTRMFLQLSALSFALALIALVLAATRPNTSGICLGLALAKPHIAGPIALCALFGKRWRLATSAGIVVVSEWAVYCSRAGVNPYAAFTGWLHGLEWAYSGPYPLVGLTSLRGWTFQSGNPPWTEGLWLAGSGALLVVACGFALLAVRRAWPGHSLAVMSLLCLWSLLAFFHNTHNLILLILPAFLFILSAQAATARERWVVIACLQIALMADVPIRLLGFAPAQGIARALIVHFDRVAVTVAFAYVAMLTWRLSRASWTQ